MTTAARNLEPLDWAMGYIRQLDDPANKENYHPYLARLSALALPVFEAYAALTKIGSALYHLTPLLWKGSIISWQEIANDFYTNGFKASLASWGVGAYTLSCTAAIVGVTVISIFGIIGHLVVSPALIAALAIGGFLAGNIVWDAMFGFNILMTSGFHGFLIQFEQGDRAPTRRESRECGKQVRRLFMDTPLHLLNITISPILGLVSPSTNDAYHQSKRVIQSIPSALWQLDSFSEKYPESTLHDLISPTPILELAKTKLSQNYGSKIILEHPTVLSILYKKDVDLFKKCLATTDSESRETYMSYSERYNRMSEEAKRTTLGLIVLHTMQERENRCFCQYSDYYLQRWPMKTTPLEIHQELDKNLLNTSEKVHLIVQSEGIILGIHLYDYLRKWYHEKPEEIFSKLDGLKNEYPVLIDELRSLQLDLRTSRFLSMKSGIFSDVNLGFHFI